MALVNVVSAFGLAGAAGLNAYIPLLVVAILARAEVLHLEPPFDILGSGWVITGLMLAGAVHGAKAAARPVVNASTVGMGAPVVSVVEDVIAAITSILAVVAPALMVLFLAIAGILLVRLIRRVRLLRKRSQAVVNAS